MKNHAPVHIYITQNKYILRKKTFWYFIFSNSNNYISNPMYLKILCFRVKKHTCEVFVYIKKWIVNMYTLDPSDLPPWANFVMSPLPLPLTTLLLT